MDLQRIISFNFERNIVPRLFFFMFFSLSLSQSHMHALMNDSGRKQMTLQVH